MKYYTYIPLFALTFFASLPILHTTYAQEFPSLGKLAQEYILRLNTNEYNTSTTTVVNPDNVLKNAIEESINTVSKTVEEVNVEKERVITEVKDAVKNDIDTSIIEIRKTTQQPAYELQRVVDLERTNLFEDITRTIEGINVVGIEKIKPIEVRVQDSLQKIKTNLESESGTIVNFEKSERDIRNSFLRFEEILIQKRVIIESREGALVYQDSDGDGVSDYDELYIYKTDPYNARTVSGDKTDGEKISLGINPTAEGEEKIKYQDPRQDTGSYVSENYNVKNVQLLKESDTPDRLVFEGSALPNTYITLYIFSTPIIVTVKTDDSGTWKYELNQELENGEHQIYVATVDNSGKIIARSNPILFTKSAEAATIGIAGSLGNSVTTENFLKDNFILITLSLLISIVILTMMFAGNHKNIKSAVNDLHNEVK